MINSTHPNSTGLLNLTTIQLDQPFGSVTEVDLKEIDFFTQSSFEELIEEHHQQTMNYIIAIASDALGNTSFADGCNFVRQYYVNGKTQSALTRRNITSVAFYTLALTSTADIKASLMQQIATNSSDLPDLSNSSQNYHSLTKLASNELDREIQFNYLCSIQDLTRVSTKDWFLKFVGAHDINQPRRAVEAGDIALIYQVGADHPAYKITDNAIKLFFKKDPNQAFYWHLQAAKLGQADSFFHLYNFYETGDVCPKSPADAFRCIEKAAELAPNSVNYLILLANRHHKGLGTKNNTDKAKEILSQINAIKSGYRV